MKPTGHARLARGGVEQRAEDRRGVDDRVGVRHRDDRAVAAGRGRAGAGLEVLLVLLAGRAQVHVRVDERREQVAPRRRRRSRRRPGAVSVPGGADLGDLAVADEHVVRRVDARCAGRARGRRGRAGRRAAGARRGAPSAASPARSRAHASCGSVGRGARALVARAGEHLVEDRHPDDDAGLDLHRDDRLRRVDDLAGQLDAAVDRAGVHEHLARPEPAAVDLVAGGVLAQARDEGLVHALVLHPQRVDDVGLAQVVEVVAHLAAERLDPARDERRRPADGHVRRPSCGRRGCSSARRASARRRRRSRCCGPRASRASGAACRRRAAPASGARACRRRR